MTHLPDFISPGKWAIAHAAAIIESSDDAIISKDLNGIVLSWNQGAETLFGYTAEEMIGQPIHRLIPKDRLEEEDEILAQLRAGSRIDHYETLRLRKDGSTVDISLTVSPLKDASGKVIGASKIARDISHRTETERRLKDLIEALPAAVYTTDAEGHITHYNQAAADVWGCKPRLGDIRWCGEWRLYLANGLLLKPDQCPLAQSLAENISLRNIELVIERPDGTRLPVLSYPTPLRDRTGRVIGGADMMIDLTDRKQAEQQLQRLAAESDQRVLERTGELLSSQKQLRALASDLTLTEQRERRRLATELHDYLAQLVVASRIRVSQAIPLISDPSVSASLASVDQMLDQALTYTRSLVAELSPHILYQFGLSKSLVWLGDQMKQHGLQVTVITHPGSLKMADDQAVLLFQSVRELLLNVAQHADTDRAVVTISVDDEHELWICVEDHGRGFETGRLFQAEEWQNKFGLLSIRERMRLLGGACEVSSSPGAGTLAILRLPLSADCLEPSALSGTPLSAATTKASEVSGRVVRVLLVDDHAMVRQGLRSILDDYEDLEVVGEAADGQDAVVLARSLHPDVVIMDVNLPLIDGIQATRILRQEQSCRTVIGISVRNDPEVGMAMTDAGAVAFLTKESAVSSLHEVILRHSPLAP
jgi:PAS domain S-box-containing protein